MRRTTSSLRLSTLPRTLTYVGTDPCDAARRVQPHPSPYLPVYCGVNPLRVTLDTGAEVNLIHASVAAATDCPVSKSNQKAYQADGHSPLAVVGETTLSLSRGDHVLTLQALVVNDLDVDVLAGTPFMSTNDVSVRPAERSVSIGECVVFRYDDVAHDPASSSARRVQCLVRSPPSPVTLWPGEYVELAVPDMDPDGPVSVEPWMSPVGKMDVTPWPHPTVSSVVAGKLRVPNNTDSPIVLKKTLMSVKCTLCLLHLRPGRPLHSLPLRRPRALRPLWSPSTPTVSYQTLCVLSSLPQSLTMPLFLIPPSAGTTARSAPFKV